MKRKKPDSINRELMWKKTCKTLSLTEEAVLELSLCWPEPEEKKLKSVGRYYQKVQERFRTQWETEQYLCACMDLIEKREEGKAFHPWRASLEGKVTWQNEKYVSIAMTVQEERGNHRILEYRWGDVWYWEDGCPVRLKECISGKRGWKGMLQKSLAEAAEGLRKQGIYLDSDEINCLYKYISPERFALTEQELIFYCPQCTAAPAVEGVLELRVPRMEV